MPFLARFRPVGRRKETGLCVYFAVHRVRQMGFKIDLTQYVQNRTGKTAHGLAGTDPEAHGLADRNRRASRVASGALVTGKIKTAK